MNKPNGQYELPPDRMAITEFMRILPTRKLGGIGKVTEQMLKCFGMTTMGDVHNHLHEIVYAFTPAISEFLVR